MHFDAVLLPARREAAVAFGAPLSPATAWQPSRSRGMVDVFA